MHLFAEATTKFTLELYWQLRESEDNIFCSPMSIMTALAMLQLGARGNTEQQIEKVLQFNETTKKTKGKSADYHVNAGSSVLDGEKDDLDLALALSITDGNMSKLCPDTPGLHSSKVGIKRNMIQRTQTLTKLSDLLQDEENVHEQFQKLMTQLNKCNDAYELKAPNSIYGAKNFPFLQTFLEDIKKYYQANVESLDFEHAAEESQKKINSWVENQTNGKIKDLFPSGSLSNSTILVLVNAVYFKGQWNHKFDEKHTTEEKFWLNKNTSKPVQMMKQRNEFNFTFLEDVQAKIVEIPYKGKELSMFVLLPVETDGLQKLEEKLTADKLLEWTSTENMHTIELYLSLPRFKVEEKYDLPGPLEHMGMVDAFDRQKADFSNMSSTAGLVVSKVLHKAFVEVNEEGTEAAAATGVEVSLTSAQISEDFYCDHPFLFFIKENNTNSILFFGRMSSP